VGALGCLLYIKNQQSEINNRHSNRGNWGVEDRLMIAWELDEAFEFADAGWVAHFPQGFGFDLADALAGDLELATDFLEGA